MFVALWDPSGSVGIFAEELVFDAVHPGESAGDDTAG